MTLISIKAQKNVVSKLLHSSSNVLVAHLTMGPSGWLHVAAFERGRYIPRGSQESGALDFAYSRARGGLRGKIYPIGSLGSSHLGAPILTLWEHNERLCRHPSAIHITLQSALLQRTKATHFSGSLDSERRKSSRAYSSKKMTKEVGA